MNHSDDLSRRDFMKKTALAAGAITLLTRGISLGDEASAIVTATASISASVSGSVYVTIPSMDLGLDINGYRSEAQTLTDKYDWKYTVPNQPMTLPHDPAPPAGGAPPNQLTLDLTVIPKDAVITFRLAGDEPGCLALVGSPTNDGNGNIKLKIRAVIPSTALNGNRRPNGTLIEAVHNGGVVGSGKFYVIKPESIDTEGAGTTIKEIAALPAVATSAYAEYEGQPVYPSLNQHQTPPATFPLPKVYFQNIFVSVLDQFDQPLGAMYAGTAVREDGIWIAWMQTGQYIDPVGATGPIVSPHSFAINVAGYGCGQIARKITISNENTSASPTTADYKLEWN